MYVQATKEGASWGFIIRDYTGRSRVGRGAGNAGQLQDALIDGGSDQLPHEGWLWRLQKCMADQRSRLIPMTVVHPAA